jgi:hypothetical protein
MGRSREVEIKVGRRSADGLVRLSAYPPQLVQLSVSYKGERSASVLLTQEQIQVLRDALAEYVEEAAPQPETTTTWDQTERRSEETLLSEH